MWTPEIVVDAERARAMIAARFPELRAERIERLGQGWDNAAYLVDGEAVFRFPQRGVAAPLIATEIPRCTRRRAGCDLRTGVGRRAERRLPVAVRGLSAAARNATRPCAPER